MGKVRRVAGLVWTAMSPLALLLVAALFCFFTTMTIVSWLEPRGDTIGMKAIYYSGTRRPEIVIGAGIWMHYSTRAKDENRLYPTGQIYEGGIFDFRGGATWLKFYPNQAPNNQREWGPLAAWWLTFPGWFCSIATGIWPAWAMMKWRREQGIQRWKELREGRICVVCGYDIRESPDRCSECGATQEMR